MLGHSWFMTPSLLVHDSKSESKSCNEMLRLLGILRVCISVMLAVLCAMPSTTIYMASFCPTSKLSGFTDIGLSTCDSTCLSMITKSGIS